jgi:hypothetical protein
MTARGTAIALAAILAGFMIGACVATAQGADEPPEGGISPGPVQFPIAEYGEGMIRYLGLGPEAWHWEYMRGIRREIAAENRIRRLERKVRWLERQLADARAPRSTESVDWVGRNIAAAEYVAAHSSGDPWPNCPDPHDGSGSSWHDTKDCESGGYGWHEDPPGYYCGPLQLDPHIWRVPIARYGVPC